MKIILNKDIITYEEHEEIIFINMQKNNMFTLDHIGTLIWNHLKENNNVEAVANYISQLYEENAEIIKLDILNLIDQLRDAGVIKVNV